MLIHFVATHFQVHKQAIHLVEYKYWFDAFKPCLTKHSLSLNTNTFNNIHKYERAITQSNGV